MERGARSVSKPSMRACSRDSSRRSRSFCRTTLDSLSSDNDFFSTPMLPDISV